MVKKQFKYVGDKHIGDTVIKDGLLKLKVKPGDIIEVDTDKCLITNVTNGTEGRQRNKDMIQGNKENGIEPIIDRLNKTLHYEEVEEKAEEKPPEEKPKIPKHRGPGRPPGSSNRQNTNKEGG